MKSQTSVAGSSDATAGRGPTVFEKACEAFDGWTDPGTGLRVLRVEPRTPYGNRGQWITTYHQDVPFIEGGRYVMLRHISEGGHAIVDLTTGEAVRMLPRSMGFSNVLDADRWLVLAHDGRRSETAKIYDARADRTVAWYTHQGWDVAAFTPLDRTRALLGYMQGRFYDEKCVTHFCVMHVDGRVEQVMEADGYFCNHVQVCPTDPDLIAYDRWPTPKRRAPQVLHLLRLDDGSHEMLPMRPDALLPGTKWGAQRDHYLWSADGNYILSYVDPGESASRDHFDFDWWVSVTNWRTGEDWVVRYPPQRWGCNFATTPDSRFIVSMTGPPFTTLYALDVQQLRLGWVEHPLAVMPPHQGWPRSRAGYHMPHVLTDQSGVLLTAGYPGSESGIFLVEWPAWL